MLKKNEQFSANNQQAIDSAMDLVKASIQSAEKLTQIQLETSRQILEETAKAVKKLVNTTDPKEVFNCVNQIAVQTVEKNIASARDVYDIVNQIRDKISKIAEESLHNLQQAALNSVSSIAQYNPGSASLVQEAIKSWINNANQALSTINKAAFQVAEFTNNNIHAATDATVNAVKKASAKKASS